MGIATDKGSNMTGSRIGLGAFLSKDCPHLVRLNDISHIYHLIASHSIKVYPDSVINIVKTICSNFNKSSIKAAKLKSIQIEIGFKEPLEILSYVKTRWLSLTDALRRIIKLWEALKKFYEEEGDENEKTFFIFKNELYLKILLVLLEKLYYYNVRFQTQDLSYNIIGKEMELSFKECAMVIVKKEKWDSLLMGKRLKLDLRLTSAEQGDLLKSDELFY